PLPALSPLSLHDALPISRFARNIKECLVYKDQLKSYGVMIWFVKENINSFLSSDEMMLKFMALGAEMEANSARTRTKIVFEQGIDRKKHTSELQSRFDLV